MPVHRTYDRDTALVLDLVRRKPQHTDLLAVVLGIPGWEVARIVGRLNAAGHSIVIDEHGIVGGR